MLADAERSGAMTLRPGEALAWDSLPRGSCCFLLHLDPVPHGATQTPPAISQPTPVQ